MAKSQMDLETLLEATSRFRLRNPEITNNEIGLKLGVMVGHGDPTGYPSCCFFEDGYLAAIRTQRNEIVVFHLFQRIRGNVGEIAEPHMPSTADPAKQEETLSPVGRGLVSLTQIYGRR